jgi:hypothetical protein
VARADYYKFMRWAGEMFLPGGRFEERIQALHASLHTQNLMIALRDHGKVGRRLRILKEFLFICLVFTWRDECRPEGPR